MLRALLLTALSLAPLAALAQEAAPEAPFRIPSHCIALAQGPALAPERVVPADWTAVAADHVLIRYLDHASFAILAADGTLAVTDYTGYTGTLDLVPDVVTMNNAHSTHWTATPDPRIPHVLRGWPEDGAPADHRLDLGGMLVRNVTTDTRGPFGEGARADGNSIFVFEAAGLCIGHLGHLHQIPTDAQYATLGRMDIVMVPVDGGYTLRLADMVQVVRRLKSRVVIPMHWFSGASLTDFLAEMDDEFDVVETGESEMVFSLDRLPSRPTILVLDPRWLD
jgi:L-ascorbate metabolism protein UlaG (beta-lactamase superfamily)